jgi:hypothetical protein
MDNHEQIQEIDAERTDADAEVANYLTVTTDTPRTRNGLAYSRTCIVDFTEGQWPEWFKSLLSGFRRLDTDPDYGFVTARYTSIPLTALVSKRPGNETLDYNRILKAAREAGWAVKEHVKGRCFNAALTVQ